MRLTRPLTLVWCVWYAAMPAARGQAVVADTRYATVRDIAYRASDTGTQDGKRPEFSRCRLDLVHPADGAAAGFATVVWFHGGGLTGGTRTIPKTLRERGFAVAGAGYRLVPEVEARECIADAAAATAWVLRHIARYGGDPARVYVGGHSAGGYLASMIAIDARWLAAEGIDANLLAGAIPCSGQAITHFTIRKARGIPDTRPVIDEFAPLFHVRKDAPPFLVITGDRDLEMLGRYEENAYFVRMLKVAGHPRVEFVEIEGQDHDGMVRQAIEHVVDHVRGDETAP